MGTHAAEQPADAANVIAPPPFIYLAGLAVGAVLELLLPSASLPAALKWGLGGALVVAGSFLARSFFRALGAAHTTISPYTSSSALVTTGVYRFSRNPGYLGMALASAGIALLFGALWMLATLIPTLAIIQFGVIRREERYLARTFGADYESYKDRTRRWL